nr:MULTISPECIES: diguanylate cyclase [unclassified Thioalkalivibrio]
MGVLAAIVFLGLFLLIDRAWKSELTERQSATVASELASLRTQVESLINGLVHSTIGLAAYAYAHPEMESSEFERVAERIHRGHEDLMLSLTLARGPVIEFVYPLEGNEPVVGLDIGAHPEQAASFYRVLREREPVVAGPWPLVQGGWGLLVRAPVDTGPVQDEPWGLVDAGSDQAMTISSIALDFEVLLDKAGIHDRMDLLRVALRGRDGAGDSGPFFYNPHDLDDDAPYQHHIRFPGGEWQLLAELDPAHAGTDRPVAWWALGLVGALAVGGYAYRVGTGLQQRRRDLDRYRGLVNRLEDPTLVVSGRRMLWANPAFSRMLGYQPPVDTELERLDLVHPDDLDRLPPQLDFADTDPETHGQEVRIRLGQGDYRYFLLRWVPVDWGEGHALLLTFVDVHENRLLFDALTAARDLQEAMFEAIPGYALVVDSVGTIRRIFGDTCHRLSPAVPLVGQRLDQLLPSELAGRFLEVVHRAIEEDTLQTYEYRLDGDVLMNLGLVEDGPAVRWFEARIRPLARSVDDLPAVVWHSLDVTERRELEARLKTMAWEDPLTGMANRAALERAFPRLAARADRQGGRLALLFIDLDHFKPVNDRHGHAVGDQLLRRVAERLKAHLRPDDVLVRLGGDEFIVLTAPLDEREEGQHLAERVRQDLDSRFEIHTGPDDAVELELTSSIGVAFYPDAGRHLSDLMIAADRAMYRVKAQGRNDVALADDVSIPNQNSPQSANHR